MKNNELKDVHLKNFAEWTVFEDHEYMKKSLYTFNIPSGHINFSCFYFKQLKPFNLRKEKKTIFVCSILAVACFLVNNSGGNNIKARMQWCRYSTPGSWKCCSCCKYCPVCCICCCTYISIKILFLIILRSTGIATGNF